VAVSVVEEASRLVPVEVDAMAVEDGAELVDDFEARVPTPMTRINALAASPPKTAAMSMGARRRFTGRPPVAWEDPSCELSLWWG
jgi:hypothetical protein